jgi:hypothetical protein
LKHSTETLPEPDAGIVKSGELGSLIIGAGIFVLTGQVAAESPDPALSFLYQRGNRMRVPPDSVMPNFPP